MTTSGSLVANDTEQIVRGATELAFDVHDANGESLTVTIIDQPSRGTLSGSYPHMTYTPQANFAGPDGLQFRATNTSGNSATAIIHLSVRRPLTASGDGWTETTIYEAQDTGQPAYGTTVNDQGTVFFTLWEDSNLGGAVVAQTRDGSRTTTPWAWDDFYGINFPYTLDADAQGNLYGVVIADTRGNLTTKMLPAGGDHLVSTPLPNPATTFGALPGIAASAAGDLAMTDPGASKVYVVPAASQTAAAVTLPSGFQPIDLDIGRDNKLYVVGSLPQPGQNSRVLLTMNLDGSNQRLTTINGYAEGVAVADDGTVYVAGAAPSSTGFSVLRMDADGNLTVVSDELDLYTGSNTLDVDRHGSVYVPELWGKRLLRIDFGHDNSLRATSSERTIRAGTTAAIALSAYDADGQNLTYVVTQPPSHGQLAGDAPTLTYTPDSGFIGTDSLTYRVSAPDGDSADATVTLDVVADGSQAVEQTASGGQTVATGYSPTQDEPTQAAVTTPVAGTVTITEDSSVADPSGYAVVGAQYRIEAPQATAQAPLRLSFQMAADQLPPSHTAEDVSVFRDGVLIGGCSDGSGAAEPDPCVSSRATADGVITITVLSSHASAWTLGIEQLATTTIVSPIAASTYGQPISLTAAVTQPGSIEPTGTVEFRDTSASPAKLLGSAPVGTDGTARLTGVLLDAGEHAIVATYAGSTTSLPSSSAPVVAAVTKAPVTVSTKAAAGLKSLLTFKVTYTTTVTSAVTGQPVVGTSVTTRINGGATSTGCTANTNSSGVAVCTAGPVNIALGGTYTASTTATGNYKAGTGTGKVPLL